MEHSVGRGAWTGSPGESAATDSRRPGQGTAVRAARERACAQLLTQQAADGHWCGQLEGDSVLESEYILLLHFLGRGSEERARKAAVSLRNQQMPGGGWSIYPGGPPEVSATVKAYFVLKLQGDDPNAPHMAAARRTALELGGIEATNTYTKIYLAMFGQYDWARCPAVPPEMNLLPGWFYFNVNEMSSWSRAIFVPLSIIWAFRPICPVPPEARIDDLYVASPPASTSGVAVGNGKQRTWKTLFYGVDRGLKLLEHSGFRPLRRRALESAETWIRERVAECDGLGAVFPSIVNAIFAFRCLGYDEQDPVFAGELRALEKLEIDLGDSLRIQPSLSPVWDTAQAINALLVAGVDPRHPALARATEWLLHREVRVAGDWRKKNHQGEVGGWPFEYLNQYFPDCDDTAAVLTALARLRPADPSLADRMAAARRRGLEWLLSMQNEDGGWAAYDRGCDKEILTLVPFADHNAMIDPSSEDITGRVLETLSLEGLPASDPHVRRAVGFLHDRQCEDGTWYGRWGCNYIYGTWLALWGLRCAGEEMGQERYVRAARWLVAHQNEDGGWGETLGSYQEPAIKGLGPSTAAQTAWALLGLIAAGWCHTEPVRRGIAYLLRSQLPDGRWDDEHWTGTGFPKVFYLRYHMYDDYFPLLALAEYAREEEQTVRAGQPRSHTLASETR